MPTPLIYPTTSDFLQKTLGAQLDEGVTASATLNNVTGIQNLKGVMIVDRVDGNGTATPNKVEVITFTGTSGSTVTSLTRGLAGTTDQDHAINAVVEFGPDIVWAQAVMDGLGQLLTSAGVLDTTKVVSATSPNFTIGSDAKGDMYVRSSGASMTRIPLGNPDSVLMVNATMPAWSQRGVQTPFITLTDASTMYMDFAVGNKWIATIVPSGARTFLATNATLGYVGMLSVKYASTASLAVNFLNAGATISWPGNTAPTPTATVNKTDMFGFVCIDTIPRFAGITIAQNI